MPRVPVREYAPRDFLREIRREEPREIARRRPRSPHFTARNLRPESEHLLGRPVCESVSRGPTKNIIYPGNTERDQREQSLAAYGGVVHVPRLVGRRRGEPRFYLVQVTVLGRLSDRMR